METALEYIQRRLNENDYKAINPHWATVSMVDVFKNTIKPELLNQDGSIISLALNGVDKNEKQQSFTVTVKQKDPKDDYDYYTYESLICDGTMVFWHDLFCKIAEKLLFAETYCTKNFDPSNGRNGYKLTYEVDEAVMLTEYDESLAPDDKPWMCSSFQLFVPIRFSAVKL